MFSLFPAVMDQEMGGSPFSVLRRVYLRSAGVPVPESEETISAYGTVHPVSPADLALFPEEYRSQAVIHIHTSVPLSLGENRDDMRYTASDLILWNGRRYLVFSVRDWSAFGFCRAFAVLQREEGS